MKDENFRGDDDFGSFCFINSPYAPHMILYCFLTSSPRGIYLHRDLPIYEGAPQSATPG